MSKKIISTENAPAAIGPYSQAVVVNGMIYTAGQVGFVPATMTFAEGGIQEQTRQVMENLKAILSAAGTSLDKVIKTTVFLADMNEFSAMNEVYATYFGEQPPARSTVEVARLPRDARVEIEVIALV